MRPLLLPAIALSLVVPAGDLGAVPLGDLDPPQHVVEYVLDSGSYDGTALGADSAQLVFETVVDVPKATWSQLRFKEAQLGAGSRIVLTSLEDGDQQHFDGQSFEVWNRQSGFFRGGAVRLELYAAPVDAEVSVQLASVLAGEPPVQSAAIDSLCGADNRIASTDNRVARTNMGGCTAWRITNGAFLTAGHCIDTDPDDGGPLVPDGMPNLSGVVQFNVPASLPNGSTVASAIVDQYPIDASSFVWRFDGEGLGLGKDWGVFRVGTNSETGLLPHEAYGFPFRVSQGNPSSGTAIRITGFGGDTTPLGTTGGGNAQHFTNQTSTGGYVEEDSSGANIWHRYTVDTEGGNSGSPIIRNSSQVTLGIHTNGGCSSGANSGTSFGHTALRNAVNSFKGSNTTHVDAGHPDVIPATLGGGTMFNPLSSFSAGVGEVATGGLLSVVAGSYGLPGGGVTIDRAMVLEAPVGSAVIGQ